MASSSFSSSIPQCTYDVFLSFRGEDTRKSFTDHLYTALDRQGIFTFRDDEELERGQPISSKLLEAIQDSKIALVVFSRNYASSTWCLDELAKIVWCMNEKGQIVFPIFYNVDPSEVRKQTGMFGEAFVAHEERYKQDGLHLEKEKMQKWRAALTQVANLSGFHLQDRHESEFVEEIIEAILDKLNGSFSSLSKEIGPLGIESHVEEIIKLCSRIEKENDVLFIGIWGMSGIGKTTLARAFYDKISSQFQVRSFLENIREVSKRDGVAALQKQLFLDFQMKSNTKKRDVREGTNEIRYRLRHKMALIILDDVDELEQLQGLAGSNNWFGQGSRIIITTKDERLLISHGVDRRYKAKELNTYEALKLFSWKVFKNDHPPNDYMELSRDFVNYAKGLPLAIEVLGPFLCGKSISEWESAFRRLKKSLEGKIMSALLMGFDGLHEEEKEIFLDIACFFKGEDRDYVAEILESFGLEPIIGISVLSKSLLTLVGSKLWMHDLLQEMGWAIVRQECSSEAGNRSRLWHSADVLDVMKYNKGTRAIQGIVLSLPQTEKLASNAFSKMEKLRFLRISNVLLPQGLKYLSTELGVLEWHRYPSKLLPENFPSDKLVHLNMRCSSIKYIWKQYKGLDKLKSIDLKDSESLIETPDFTGAPNLERLILEGCTKLSKVHPSISNLKRLILLNMKNCKGLRILPYNISLESLEIFNLSGCVQLKRFPEIVGNMECLSKLYLDGTAIKELPMSIERLTGLSSLNLAHCKNLSRLPSVLSNLTRLKMIILLGCSNLAEIPENIDNVECLEELDISGTAIRQMPSSIVYLKNLKELSCSRCAHLSTSLLFPCVPEVCPGTGLLSPASFSGFCSLAKLDLSCCNLFDGAIPNDLNHLSSLKELYLQGNNFTSIPKSICRLSKLLRLYLEGCRQLQSLPKLPTSIRGVWVNDCTSLKSDSDQYEVWDSSEKGKVYIIKRSISPMCYVEMSISQFAAWLHRYHEVNKVEINQSLKAAHGLSARVYAIPKWFNNRSRSSSFPVTTPLPTDLNNKSRLWIGYALYVGLEILEDFDTSRDLEVRHKFDCYFDTMEGSRDKKTLYHEMNVKDIPFIGKIGYWISIPYLWFLEQVNDLNECSSIETQTIIDSPDVEVKFSGARLLHEQQDFIGFVLAIKSNNGAARIRKKKKENSGQDIKSAMKEQGEVTAQNLGSSINLLPMLTVVGGCKIDLTIPLKEHLRSLPSDIECYEGQKIREGKYYLITGKLPHPLTASLLGEILQEYSGQHCLSYTESFPQCQIPEWFCSVNRPFATFPLDPLSSTGTGIRWKGIAVCAALRVHSDPSVKWENPRIECRIGTNIWELTMSGDFTETLVSLKGPGMIWIWYASRGSFAESMLNECSSVRVGFETNSKYLRVHSCGHQVVYHQNVEELMETILQCSTTSKNINRGKNSLSCPKEEKKKTVCGVHFFASLFFLFSFCCWIISLFRPRS